MPYNYEETQKKILDVLYALNERVKNSDTMIATMREETDARILKNNKMLQNTLDKNMVGFSNEINALKERADNLEYRSEVTNDMEINIKDHAHSKVARVLREHGLDYNRYFKPFIMRLYKDMTHNDKGKGRLGSRIATTMKGEYDALIKGIDDWSPSCGVENLKLQVDNNARARVLAREMGY